MGLIGFFLPLLGDSATLGLTTPPFPSCHGNQTLGEPSETAGIPIPPPTPPPSLLSITHPGPLAQSGLGSEQQLEQHLV